jgi:hypothetical protein
VSAQREVAIDYTLAAARAFSHLSASPATPFRFVFTSGLLAIRDQSATVLFMGPARKVKGEAETQLLDFAAQPDLKGKLEAFVTRPGLVHAPGTTTTSVIMAPLPANLAGVKVDELAAASLDLAVNGDEKGGRILENVELVTKGKALLKKDPCPFS